MKCVVVVNQLNDPFYIDYDKDFATYIIDRAKAKGLLEKDAEFTELDPNLMMQLFSPLVLSQWLLIETTKEPCSSILCPGGFLFAFRHMDDLLFMAISGDGTETEAFLHRKLQVFITVMRFMFGPVSEELGQAHSYTKKAKWDFLRQLMQNWSELVQSEQGFLAEAIERVHVNQLVNEKCVEVLEKSVKQFQAARDYPVQHAVLLVNNKLLALYSKRSAHELHAKHILTLMILAKTMYPSSDKLEDLFSRQYPNPESKSPLSVHIDDNSDGGEDEYHSAQNSPGPQRSSSPTIHVEEITAKPAVSCFISDELSFEDSEKTATGGVDSSKHCSHSRSGSYPNSDSSDQDTLSQLSLTDKKFTLIDLYNEKYPSEKLKPPAEGSESEKFPETEVSAEKGERKTRQNSQNVISVMVDVHQEAEMNETLQKANKPTGVLSNTEAIEDNGPIGTNDQINRNDSPKESNRHADAASPSAEKEMPQFSDISQDTKCGKENSDSDQQKLISETQNVTRLLSGESELKYGVDTSRDSPESGHAKTHKDNTVIIAKESASKRQPEINSLTETKVLTAVKDAFPSEFDPDTTQKPDLQGLYLPWERDNGLTDPHECRTVHAQAATKSQVRESPAAEEKSVLQQSQAGSEAYVEVRSNRSGTESSNRSSSRSSNFSQQDQMFDRDASSFSQVRADADFQEDLQASKKIRPKSIAGQRDPSLQTATSTFAQDLSFLSGSTIRSFGGHFDRGFYTPQTVFLETPSCLYSPYSIHTLQILPGITLMLLSQAPRHTLADSLYHIIHNVQDLMYGRRAQMTRLRAVHVHDVISSLLTKVHNSLKKQKGRIRTLSFEIHERWEKDDLKYKLLDFLEKDPSTVVPPELESPMTEMYKKLKELFSHLFLTHLPQPPQLSEALSQLRLRISKELEDYREYLNVKSRRNITMTSYINDFPGLIHFLFINRRFHQLTAPSLNIETKESMDATGYLKEKIWTMYQHMMNKLKEGYTTVMMRDGDFYFSYFLWFEDYTGNVLPVQESFKPVQKMPYPGILCGSFYRDLLEICFPHAMKDSVYCFEVFLMHLGTAHPQYIASHCKKLAHKIWEMSGETYKSISLL